MKTDRQLIGEIAYIAACGAECARIDTVATRGSRFRTIAQLAAQLAEAPGKDDDARSTIRAQAATIADLQRLFEDGVEREMALKREIARLKAGSLPSYPNGACDECQSTLGEAHADNCAYRNPEESRS